MLKEMKRQSDYVFLDGINLHGGADDTGISPGELEEICRQRLINRNVYAKGSIRRDDFPRLKEMGFGGVVIRDELWQQFDVHNDADFKQLLAYYRQVNVCLE